MSGNQANIPARIRRELGIDDGDQLRWQLEDDGSIRVHVFQQQTGTFADFDGYAGEETSDVTKDHDAWDVDIEVIKCVVHNLERSLALSQEEGKCP